MGGPGAWGPLGETGGWGPGGTRGAPWGTQIGGALGDPGGGPWGTPGGPWEVFIDFN